RVAICLRLDRLGDRWLARLHLNPGLQTAPGDRRLPPTIFGPVLTATGPSPKPETEELRHQRERSAQEYAGHTVLGAVKSFQMAWRPIATAPPPGSVVTIEAGPPRGRPH